MISFPIIKNIYDVLPYIKDRDEFIVSDKGSYIVINYNVVFADTFLDPEENRITEDEKLKRQIRRECRGLIFDGKTNEIIRRPLHKFKNLNESEETQDHKINLSNGHVILEKLDGSMIAPFYANGQMIFGTKMGATDVAKPVEDFVNRNPHYIDFSCDCIEKGYTPIFEWCSRKQRIVLDYSEDQLILVAIRKMDTGVYTSYQFLRGWEKHYNIPVVRAFEPQTDIRAFQEYVRDQENLEGFVIRFDDGHMIKLKCHWYLQIHKAKEAILQDRNIVELILEEHLDDIKAHLPPEDRVRLDKFESDFNKAVQDVSRRLAIKVYNCQHIGGMDRKTFALSHAPKMNNFDRQVAFSIWEDAQFTDAVEITHQKVRNTIRNNLSRTAKYEEIRAAWFPEVIYNEL